MGERLNHMYFACPAIFSTFRIERPIEPAPSSATGSSRRGLARLTRVDSGAERLEHCCLERFYRFW
jgi:hypothetical protein